MKANFRLFSLTQINMDQQYIKQSRLHEPIYVGSEQCQLLSSRKITLTNKKSEFTIDTAPELTKFGT